jgi:hypothetical protein
MIISIFVLMDFGMRSFKLRIKMNVEALRLKPIRKECAIGIPKTVKIQIRVIRFLKNSESIFPFTFIA